MSIWEWAAGPSRDAAELCRTLEAACAMDPTGEPGGAGEERVELVLRRADADKVYEELSRALVHRRRVRIAYVKGGAKAPEARLVEPWHLLHAEGESYLLGHDLDRAEPRLFRCDRVLSARMTDAACTEAVSVDPSEVDLGGSVRLVMGHAVEEYAEVRYSPKVARWVRERFAGEDLEGGGYTVHHLVLAEDWLVRHVLSFGEDAELVRPARLRDAVLRAVGG